MSTGDAPRLGLPSSAMVLAAGSGTRLHPLTTAISKTMVPVAGKPVLAHVIEHLRKYGVTNLVINLHHQADAIRDYFRAGDDWGVSITYSIEETLLGTAGAVAQMRDHFNAPFFVWYGDNISTCRLDRLYGWHRTKRAAASLALFQRPDPTASGVAELDDDDRIARFLEKPRMDETSSRWVNAGIYVLEPEVLTFIPPEPPVDFGRDVFPGMLAARQRLYGYRMDADERLWWIDTPADLARVERAFHDMTR